MNENMVRAEYEGLAVSFGEDGWFNATQVAGNFGKRPVDWLALDTTREYIATLTEVFNCEKISLLKTKRGRHHSGTWFHPKLAVPFARWLDPRFAVWCDYQIDQLLRGNHPHLARIEEQNRRIEEMVAANRQANKQIKAREAKKAKEKGV